MTASSGVVQPHIEEEGPGGAAHGTKGIDTALLGMMLFIASEIMFFAGLFGVYFNVRSSTPVWPPEGIDFIEPFPLTAVGTVLLVLSSFTIQWAIWRIRKGDRTGLVRGLAVTLLLGGVFLGIQMYEYYHFVTAYNFGIDSGAYGTLFYTLTGFHGAHVFGGIVGISVILLRALQGQFSARHHIAVEAVSAYWHFVDVVWIALFVTIYLLK
ncbi:MAG: heme-copper oxidase subunit III [Chloroflexi bacterium]|nr:heme-copper oxidase subunit III [Chloroflexota bacterium]